MELEKIINDISALAKDRLKPDLIKFGKNYRAISESSILETLNPLFKTYGIAYYPEIVSSELRTEKLNAGRDSGGNLIQTLMFVAIVHVRLAIYLGPESVRVDGIGMGVDVGDKAMGKAFTGAVKYALLKGFRLQYSDDPDARRYRTGPR